MCSPWRTTENHGSCGGFPTGCTHPYSDTSSLHSCDGCASASTTSRCATCSASAGLGATNGCTATSAMWCESCSRSCPNGRASTPAPVRALIAHRDASPSTHHWYRLPRETCRRWTSAVSRCTTAQNSDCVLPRPGVWRPQRAVEITHLGTVLRVGEPARLHGRVAAEDAAGIAGQAQPVLEVGAGPQPRVARSESPPATSDENQQADDGRDGDGLIPAVVQPPERQRQPGAGHHGVPSAERPADLPVEHRHRSYDSVGRGFPPTCRRWATRWPRSCGPRSADRSSSSI